MVSKWCSVRKIFKCYQVLFYMARPGNKKYLIIAWCLTFIGTIADAQNLKDYLSEGDKFYQKRDYGNALKSYLEALKFDDTNAGINFKIGISYLHSEKKSKAVAFLEKVYSMKPDVDPDIDYHLAMAYQNNHQYAAASKHYAAFKVRNKKLSSVINQKIKECAIGDSLLRHPGKVEIHALGSGINSSFSDSSPIISSDGQTLIFTSNRASDDYKIKSGTNLEDIFIVHRKNGQWSNPQKIGTNLNTKFNDAAISLSHDGRTLFLQYEEGQGDIYTSILETGIWTIPVPLNRFINNPHYRETAACISADGKKLYFSSNRPGGRGNFDLYVCELDTKGQWGRPSNLGSTINTKGDEDSPYMHPDGVTLFFSSDGQPTMGGSDIFKSKLKDGKWTKPENLGYPINSSEQEGFFTLSADNKTGYYAAVREEGLGSMDIYTIAFSNIAGDEESGRAVITETQPKEGSEGEDLNVAEPDLDAHKSETLKAGGDFIDPLIHRQKEKNIVTKLSGKVIDVNTSIPLSATISLVDNRINRIISKITSDDSGDFELIIPHGGNYGVITEKNGYLFNSINFTVPVFEKYQEVDTHILMVKAEVGSKAILKNIFFDVGKSDLKIESLSELENVRDLLLQHVNLHVQINGHTDITGDAAYNRALSLKRAESVIGYLIKKGIEPKRVKAKGYGSERPLVSNDDEKEGRQINRRTEIEIIESAGKR